SLPNTCDDDKARRSTWSGTYLVPTRTENGGHFWDGPQQPGARRLWESRIFAIPPTCVVARSAARFSAEGTLGLQRPIVPMWMFCPPAPADDRRRESVSSSRRCPLGAPSFAS